MAQWVEAPPIKLDQLRSVPGIYVVKGEGSVRLSDLLMCSMT